MSWKALGEPGAPDDNHITVGALRTVAAATRMRNQLALEVDQLLASVATAHQSGQLEAELKKIRRHKLIIDLCRHRDYAETWAVRLGVPGDRWSAARHSCTLSEHDDHYARAWPLACSPASLTTPRRPRPATPADRPSSAYPTSHSPPSRKPAAPAQARLLSARNYAETPTARTAQIPTAITRLTPERRILRIVAVSE
jgi:hypothetical protein